MSGRGGGPGLEHGLRAGGMEGILQNSLQKVDRGAGLQDHTQGTAAQAVCTLGARRYWGKKGQEWVWVWDADPVGEP